MVILYTERYKKRQMGLEPTAFCMASRRSKPTELLARNMFMIQELLCKRVFLMKQAQIHAPF